MRDCLNLLLAAVCLWFLVGGFFLGMAAGEYSICRKIDGERPPECR